MVLSLGANPERNLVRLISKEAASIKLKFGCFMLQTGIPKWVRAIEYDGPSHFLACKAATGATLIKRRHLELLGYKLVSLPFWEWDPLSCRGTETKAGIHERRKYLEAKLKLQCNVDGDRVAASSRQPPPPPLAPRYQPLRS